MHIQIHNEKVLWVAKLVLALIFLGICAWCYQALGLLGIAKLIMALIMFGTAFLCFKILYHSREWKAQLQLLEIECDVARDQVMFQATVLRSQLAEVQDRLHSQGEAKPDFEIIGNLVKQAVPLVSLFMAKETSLIKWGLAGAKLAKSAFDYFSRKQDAD